MLSSEQEDQLRDWLGATARQDGAAFRRLYDATSAKLFGLAVRILGKDELAEEVLQDSYVSIWHSAAGYRPALAAPMTWMTAIVRNKAFDALRRRGGQGAVEINGFDPEILQAMESDGPTPFEALQISSDAGALALCMKRLEALHRQAIALAFYHDLSHSEVAGQLRLPIGTIKTWIRRGLGRLRACLTGLEGA